MRITPVLMLLLAACNTPARGFDPASRHEMTLEGFHFIVYRQGDEVQVIRTGWVPKARRDRIPPLMERAAEMATGCRAVPGSLRHQLPGDTAEGKLRVAC